MGKLSKRTVDQATPHDADYFIWDDELPGFGLRVFASGRRSYVVQYRAKGRTRRFTIGVHGVWTPETARREARVLLGRIAHGDNPAEQRELDHRAITVKELCERYMADAKAGLILGKKQRPKKASTIYTDEGRITPHVLRHSFASIANGLGFTESTVAALLGHAQGSVTSRYIHAVDTSLIMAADTVAEYIQALLEGAQFQRRGYALDRASREMALSRHLGSPLPPGVSHLAEASAADPGASRPDVLTI